MSKQLDKWIFDHAQKMGNVCLGIKNNKNENVAFEDLTTGETVDLTGSPINTNNFNYKIAAIKLWQILDDIDTAGDQAKENDKSYRAYVESRQIERFEVFTSDGYKLFLAENKKYPID